MIIENQKNQEVSQSSRLGISGPVLFGLFKVVKKVGFYWRYYKLRQRVAAERRRLLELPEHRLKDMGILQKEARLESQRRADDLPTQRLNEL